MMKTKEVCEKLCVTPKMLRVYEDACLLNPLRNENNYREYSLEDLTRLNALITLRGLDFPIKEIKTLFEKKKQSNENIYNFYIRLKVIKEKIKEYKKAEKIIKITINQLMNNAEEQDIIKLILEEKKGRADIKDNIIKSWDFDTMAINYIERYLKDDGAYIETINTVRSMIDKMDKSLSILDVGCGTCNLWKNLKRIPDLTAIDISLQMLMVSEKNVPWAKLILEDILEENLEHLGKFDVIISTFCLHHIPTFIQTIAIKNIINLCKKEGKIIIADKNLENPKQRFLEEQKLLKSGNSKKLEILRSEYNLYTDEMIKYLNYLDCSVHFNYISDGIGLYIITKQ